MYKHVELTTWKLQGHPLFGEDYNLNKMNYTNQILDNIKVSYKEFDLNAVQCLEF